MGNKNKEWGRPNWLEEAGIGRLYLFREDKRVHTKIRQTLVCLKIAPKRCWAYIVAWLNQARNYNDTGVVC
jgi:hypothetical protein